MVTKTIIVDGGEYRIDSDGLLRPVKTYYINSEEKMPFEGAADADKCYIKDTGEFFVFDADGTPSWEPV